MGKKTIEIDMPLTFDFPFHGMLRKNRKVRITRREGKKEFTYTQAAGRGEVFLISKEDCEVIEVFREEILDSFVCHVSYEIPADLDEKTMLYFRGCHFIPAGTLNLDGELLLIDCLEGLEPMYTDCRMHGDEYKWDYAAFQAVTGGRTDIYWLVEEGCYVYPGVWDIFKYHPIKK